MKRLDFFKSKLSTWHFLMFIRNLLEYKGFEEAAFWLEREYEAGDLQKAFVYVWSPQGHSFWQHIEDNIDGEEERDV